MECHAGSSDHRNQQQAPCAVFAGKDQGSAAFAAGEWLGLRLAERPRRVRRAAKALAALKKTRPFWS